MEGDKGPEVELASTVVVSNVVTELKLSSEKLTASRVVGSCYSIGDWQASNKMHSFFEPVCLKSLQSFNWH